MEVKDNFLDDIHLTKLDTLINDQSLPWYLQKEQTKGQDDGCWLLHSIYDTNVPRSNLYDPVIEIFNSNLKYISLCRITINLLLRQESPNISSFHTDFDLLDKLDEEKMTTSIFYLNTNNGYTEFEGGDIIDCVRNRLIIFPTTTSHRAVGQTDVSKRIVLNFNYIL